MAKEGKLKAKVIEEDEDKEEKPVTELSSDDEDDDEANRDLSLKIMEKALLTRAAKLAKNDKVDVAVLDEDGNDSRVVGARGSNKPSSSSAEPSVDEVKKKNKKKKILKAATAMKEDKAEAEEKAETIEKVAAGSENGEAVQTTTELDQIVARNAIEMPENMVLRKLLRGPRYFDSPDGGWSTCYNCGKGGHMAVNCPSFEKKKRPCFLCGSLDHGVKACSKERVCIICKSVGHRPNKCPEKHNGGPQNSKACLKCGDFGHNMFSCKNNYSFDDLKEIRCYTCENVGHLCCVNVDNNSPREVSCYTCGEMGHTGLECSSLHDEATTTTSSNACFICGEEGHFARQCSNSTEAGMRNYEPVTPTLKLNRKNKKVWGFKSAPQHLGKSRKKRKSVPEERSNTTPKKLKQRDGWLTEDSEDFFRSQSKMNHWRSPSTPAHKGYKNSAATGGQMSSSQSSKRIRQSHSGLSSSLSNKQTQNYHWKTSTWQGSDSPYHHRYSASRFSNSSRRNYNRW